uniref:Uncharacterized protein n=1 Tax=Aegilops tauschii subsp. strangulata TaxID=200361 RepID=A0A453L7V0_AEGTS
LLIEKLFRLRNNKKASYNQHACCLFHEAEKLVVGQVLLDVFIKLAGSAAVATLPALLTRRLHHLLHLGSQVRPGLARRLQLHRRGSLLRVRAHAGQKGRAPRLLVLPPVAHAGAQVAQLLLDRLTRGIISRHPRRRPLHGLQPGVQHPCRAGVLPSFSGIPCGRDVLGRGEADALPLHLHARRRQVGQLQRPLDHRRGCGGVGGLPCRGVLVGAGHLHQAGDRLRGPGSRHVHEHQEAPLLAVVELADVDGGGAAVDVHVVAVAAGLDFLDAHATVQARDGDARLLHGDRQEPADALRERVLDRRLVPDEGEGAARGLRDSVHPQGVVVGAEAERVDRPGPAPSVLERGWHKVHVVLAPEVRVLAVGEKDHAGDGVLVPAADEHLGAHMEALADVGARTGNKGLHRQLRRGLAGVRHAREAGQAGRPIGEGHDGEAIGRAELIDDEGHGPFQQSQLFAIHAAADIEHGDEVERRARHVGGRPGVDEHRELVPGRAPPDGRELAVSLEDQPPAVVRQGFLVLHRLVVLVVRGSRGRGRGRRRHGEPGKIGVRH